jgi:tellurite resistance protein TehA-like permease
MTETAASPAFASSSPGALETLPPAYFALVMSTGIVAIAARLLGLTPVSDVLLVLNPVFYIVLWILFVLRSVRHSAAFRRDLVDPGRGVGFFTLVAGTCVLGAQLVIELDALHVAAWLWFLSLFLYVIVIYGLFTSFTVRRNKPDVRHGLNGAWLVLIVATQGISVLGGNVVSCFSGQERLVLFTTLAFWLVGGMLYIWVMGLIFYRYMFLELDPAELGPPYWVDMGAVAISTLAGDVLIGNLGKDPLLLELAPFVKGFTFMFWGVATWWIPILLLLGFWRHVISRFPLRYDPAYWAMVFPLGMYTVCTFKLAHSLELPGLLVIPKVFVGVAVIAWTATFFGLLHTLGKWFLERTGGAGKS